MLNQFLCSPPTLARAFQTRRVPSIQCLTTSLGRIVLRHTPPGGQSVLYARHRENAARCKATLPAFSGNITAWRLQIPFASDALINASSRRVQHPHPLALSDIDADLRHARIDCRAETGLSAALDQGFILARYQTR